LEQVMFQRPVADGSCGGVHDAVLERPAFHVATGGGRGAASAAGWNVGRSTERRSGLAAAAWTVGRYWERAAGDLSRYMHRGAVRG
jgi:hypothetical protein